MFATTFGGNRTDYMASMDPMLAWLFKGETKMAADSFICFHVHLALERVFRRVREDKAKGLIPPTRCSPPERWLGSSRWSLQQ